MVILSKLRYLPAAVRTILELSLGSIVSGLATARATAAHAHPNSNSPVKFFNKLPGSVVPICMCGASLIFSAESHLLDEHPAATGTLRATALHDLAHARNLTLGNALTGGTGLDSSFALPLWPGVGEDRCSSKHMTGEDVSLACLASIVRR